jgi:MoaA/NifB/PqqE/SkfB family radical SAM enzyme
MTITNITNETELKDILAKIANGATFYIATCTRITKIDAAVISKFEKAGIAVLKVKADGLYMAHGRKYVYAGLTAQYLDA